MPANVLLTGGERQTVGFFSINIDASADDSARHEAKVRLGAGKDTVQRAATSDRTSEWLTFTDHDVGAVVAGSLNHAEGDGLNTHDEGRVFADDFLDAGQPFIQHAKRVWLFKVDAARTCSLAQGVEVKRSVLVVGKLANFNFRALAIIEHHREFVRWRQR